MSVNSAKYIHDYANKMAQRSQRQMPVFSQIGKGPKGDSFSLNLRDSGTEVYALVTDSVTGESTEMWSKELIEFVPKMHYRLWGAVREVDGIVFEGYYMSLWCNIEWGDSVIQFWGFSTPFTPTKLYRFDYDPDDPPEDYVISEDGQPPYSNNESTGSGSSGDSGSGSGNIHIDPIEDVTIEG